MAAAQELLADGAGAARSWVREAAGRLNERTTVVFRIGALRLGAEPSRRLARAIATALAGSLKDDLGLPPAARLLLERPELTGERHPYPTRTLLPHHDGQHRSYLTPSTLDCPDWQPVDRTFSAEGFVRSGAQTLYQGFFLAAAGSGLSLTAYYDLLGLVEWAYGRCEGGTPDIPAVAAWAGANVVRAKRRAGELGVRYLTIGGLLGAGRPEYEALSYEVAQAPVPRDLEERFPALTGLRAACPCGLCQGETERVHCHMLFDATGMGWALFRDRHELGLPSQDFDLVLSENLSVLHSGIEGGRDRLLEPVSIVVDSPEGPDYERWLGERWRRPRLLPLD
jgi:hypothetical protein